MKKLISIIIIIIIVIFVIRLVNIGRKPRPSEVNIETPVFEEEPNAEFEPLLDEQGSQKEALKKSDFQLEAITFEDEPSSILGEIFD